MVRRGLSSSLLAAAIVVAAAAPAAAAGTPQIRSPFAGSTVDGQTPVQARVDEECGIVSQDTASSVEVRLLEDEPGADTFPGSQVAALERTKACDSEASYSDWGGVEIDPDRPTPFFGSDPAPMCNGRWRIQGRADGGAWGQGVPFTVSNGPEPPTGLAVSVDGSDVTISWAANPEPDLVGYRVERRRAGSTAWAAVEVLTGTSTTDAGVSDGDWEYRVVALRGDGEGVPACADDEPDLSAASQVTTASVETRSTSTGGSGTSDGGSTDSDGTSDGSSDGGSSTTGSTSDGTSDGDAGDGGTTTDGSDSGGDGGAASDGGDTGTSTGSPRRVAPPPSATRTGPDLETPELPAVAGPQERYYGEGEGYSDELDFGSVDPVTGSETTSRSTTSLTQRVVPQAVQDFVSRYVDPERVLKPIATGLVLVALALHVRRWSREHDAARR